MVPKSKKKVAKMTKKRKKTYKKTDEFTSLLRKIRGMKEYKEWRSKVIERDRPGFMYINVHHLKHIDVIIKENNIWTVDDARKCKELWDVSNGVAIRKGEHQIITLIERMKLHSKGFIDFLEYYVKNKEEKLKK